MPTVPSAQPKPRQASSLINTVARSVGKENNATARAEAMEYLNEIINEMNMDQPWQMLRTESTGNAFTANTADYSLASDIHRVEKMWITNASDDTVAWTVDYFDYAQYKDFDQLKQAETARYYTTRNIHGDAKVTFIGTPGSSFATDKEWNYSYVARIPLIGSESGVIDIPREFDVVLVAGGRWKMRDNTSTVENDKVARSFQEYQYLKKRLRQLDRLHPDEHPRFRLNMGSPPLGINFIQV